MKTIAIYSIKGGVGKTTAAVNLAYEAGRSGVRVLLWDLDPQGGATYLVRARPKIRGGARRLLASKNGLSRQIRATDLLGVHIVSADLSLRHLDLHLAGTRSLGRLARLLAPVRKRYDLAILDCAPGLALASEAVFAAAHVLVVPVVPATLASRTLEQLDAVLGARGDRPDMMPLLSMVDRRRSEHQDVSASISDAWPDTCKAFVPDASVVERMGVERKPLAEFAPTSEPALAFREVWHELAHRMWN